LSLQIVVGGQDAFEEFCLLYSIQFLKKREFDVRRQSANRVNQAATSRNRD